MPTQENHMNSFIIASKEKVNDIKIEVPIKSLINFTISSKEELNDYFLNEYEYDVLTSKLHEKYILNLYHRCSISIEAGNTLYIGSGSSNGHCGIAMMAYNEFHGANISNGKIIEIDQKNKNEFDNVASNQLQ